MKKLILLLGVLAMAFSMNTAFAAPGDANAQFCTDKGYIYQDHETLGAICVFNETQYCPATDFAVGSCGEEFQAGLQCEAGKVPYQNQCVTPFPYCKTWAESALSCIDKIEDGKRMEQFEFTCYENWEKTEPVYDANGDLTTPGMCKYPCDAPNVEFNGQCVPPFPTCENAPENSDPATCIDRINVNGTKTANFAFMCADGFVKIGTFCLDEASVLPDFPDVARTHKNYDAIKYLQTKKVFKGYADGTFGPGNSINRAELIKVLVEGMGMTPTVEEYSSCYPDVTDQWFAPYVCYASSIGWVNGYPDGTFGPAKGVNKVEALKIILNAANVDVSNATKTYSYTDVPTDQWFAPYVAISHDLGILEETGTTFNPSATRTRAEIAENLYRLLTL